MGFPTLSGAQTTRGGFNRGMHHFWLEVFHEFHELSEAAVTGIANPVILPTNMPSHATTIFFIFIAIIFLALVSDSFTAEEH